MSLINADLPTNYEYYTSGGISSGLSTDQPYFTLNDRNITLYSGAMHYFRVPRAYWRDRLRKMRAAGLNTVETYIPWNLHEPHSGVYDFGDGDNYMSDFLHMDEFFRTAQEEDLFAIVRPGPYICAEYEFGGFPGWLLRENDTELRTSNPNYMKYVRRYFSVLIPLLTALQFINGGPILMFQVENEYAGSGKSDMEYIRELQEQMVQLGVQSILSTADNPDKAYMGTIPELLFMTANFGDDPKTQLDMFKELQPGKPLLTMEFWTGGTDYWGYKVGSNQSAETFESLYEGIVSYPASINVYMFHGGTSFGFLNGALNLKYDGLNTDYHAFINSYDLYAPITESGDYSPKYYIVKNIIEKYNPIKTYTPDVPEIIPPIAYSNVKIEQQIDLKGMLESITPLRYNDVIPMEKLDLYNNSGQNFGYVVYRKNLNIPANGILLIEGRVCDSFMLLVDGKLLTPWLVETADLNKTGTSLVANSEILLTNTELTDATLEIVVENWGRVNIGDYIQYKGLWQGGVKLNDEYLYDWDIQSLEFSTPWINNLTNWKPVEDFVGPALYKGTLTIDGTPKDTFVNTESWIKGIVIVNDFVLGRYASMGPIQTLYLPGPLLREGTNDIMVFEHFKPNENIEFSDKHIWSMI